jgi:hypothetical protein
MEYFEGEGKPPLVLAFLEDGPTSKISSSSGAGRFKEVEGEVGDGVRATGDISLRGGFGKGEGKMNGGASAGWSGLRKRYMKRTPQTDYDGTFTVRPQVQAPRFPTPLRHPQSSKTCL